MLLSESINGQTNTQVLGLTRDKVKVNPIYKGGHSGSVLALDFFFFINQQKSESLRDTFPSSCLPPKHYTPTDTQKTTGLFLTEFIIFSFLRSTCYVYYYLYHGFLSHGLLPVFMGDSLDPGLG